MDCYIPIRYIYMILGFCGMLITYGLKTNLAMAMVSMVNHTAIRLEQEQHQNSSRGLYFNTRHGEEINVESSVEEDGTFLWSLSLQGVIISSYFWGYLLGQLPGARLAEDLSGTWTFFAGVSSHIIGTLLIPPTAYLHYSAVIFIRVIQGFLGGFTFPSLQFLLTRWAPLNERSLMSSFVYSGGLLGNVISLLATAYIAHRTNWEASFYIMGGVCIPWMVLWPLLINDNPRTHKLIRQDELNYLIAALQLAEKKQRLKVPWKSIFLSGQIWTLIITHTSIGWGFYFMLTQLPLYMKMVLQFNLNENGIATSLPFIGMFLFSVFYGRAADYVISKEVLSLTLIRKFSNILATGVAALCCSIVPFTTNKYAVVALMVIATTVLGALYSGLMQSYMDLARNFAGTLIAITNTVATLAGIAVPLFVGWILNQDPSVASWRIVFLVTTGFYLLATIVYGLFITTTELPWNKPIEAPNRDEEGK